MQHHMLAYVPHDIIFPWRLYHITCFQWVPHGVTFPIKVIPHHMFACVPLGTIFPWRLYHIPWLHVRHMTSHSHGGYTIPHTCMGATWYPILMEVIPHHMRQWVPHVTTFPWRSYHSERFHGCHIPVDVIPYQMIACMTHVISFSWRLYHITCVYGCHMASHSHCGYTTSHASMGDT